jgi:ankyrin repeat protein
MSDIRTVPSFWNMYLFVMPRTVSLKLTCSCKIMAPYAFRGDLAGRAMRPGRWLCCAPSEGEAMGFIKRLFGWTPLQEAARDGNREEVDRLLDASADVNARGNKGCTALTTALIEERWDVAELLLERGADPRIADNQNNTPILHAASGASAELIRALLDAGADVSARGASIPRMGLTESDVREQARLTPAFVAAAAGNASALEVLIERGADLGGSPSPLVAAVEFGHEKVARKLIDAGAEVDRRGHGGAAALIMASQCGFAGIVEDLLAAGADPSLCLDNGANARACAEAALQDGIVRILERRSSRR